jgi:cystathionine beta-lyase/cystathionine gamma-synthase
MDKKNSGGFATRAIHVGQSPDPATGAVNVPIYASSTFVQEEIGKFRQYEYSRVANPTRTALEESLASLEGGTSAHVFASGMAAIAALATMMKSGDHIVSSNNMYGGTTRYFSQVLTRYGIDIEYVDTTDPKNIERALRPATKLVHIETPANPMMVLTDIRAVTDICHRQNVEVSADNTFMSPYFQRPIEMGVDLVVHSTTKFLNGHSDGLGGAIVGTKPEHAETFGYVQKCAGAILSPFECWLLLRGVKTLPVRMRQHEANAGQIAEWLHGHKKVKTVLYPGLKDHPQHELAKRQASGFGSMISFDVGPLDAAKRFFGALKMCALAESLGGVETLVCHPFLMTHSSISEQERRAMGITDGLVRLSVGIEDVEDIIADLDRGLAAV